MSQPAEQIDEQLAEELEAVREEEERQAQERQAARAGLVHELTQRKEQAVRHKYEVEQRWIEDERQYWGIRQAQVSDEGEEEECPPINNITQQKVLIAASRIGDMLFPTNDKNWALQPTPDPTDIDGQPIPPEVAEEATKRASEKIDDYLNECHYAKHGRQAIFDACKLGIGVIKGPFPKSSTRRVVRRRMEPALDEAGQPVVDPYTGEPEQSEVIELQMAEETKPGSTRVDPWMFFTLPCRSMEECEGAFELHQYPRSKMQKVADYPGFDKQAIREALKTNPKWTDTESSLMRERRLLLRNEQEPALGYMVWEYHGPFETKWLQSLGFDVGDDPLDAYHGEAWFCDGHLLKLELNAILGDDRVPYHVFCYMRDDADILNSYGLCRVLRDDQRSIDITYEAMQYNVRLCSGPQSIHWEGRAEPADGNYQIRGPKHWRVTDPDVSSIKDVIQFENIESTVGQIMPFYELAKQNADDQSQLPMIAHGEATNVQQTAWGTAMQMNSMNIVQRRAAHLWDDDVTIPMLTRYYWWLMEFDDDDSIKVEMEVDPRGSSYLLVKDQQAGHAMQVMAMTQDPEFRQRIKMDGLYETVLNFLDVPTDRFLKTEDELAEEQNSPEAQQQQQMQARAMEAELAEAEAKAAKAKAEAAKAEAELQGGDQGPDQKALLEFEREQMRAQQQAAELEAKMIIAQMERDARLAQAAGEQQIKLADLQARLETAEQDRLVKTLIEQNRTEQAERQQQRQDFQKGMEARLKIRQQEMKEQNMSRGFDSF